MESPNIDEVRMMQPDSPEQATLSKEPTVRLILLTGKAGVGKSTIAQALRTTLINEDKTYRTTAYVLAFSTPLKKLVDTLITNVENVPTLMQMQSNKEEPDLLGKFSYRKLCQIMGTEFGRDMIDQNIWIYCMFSKIASILNETYTGTTVDNIYFIIDDARFDNEISELKDTYKTVRVVKLSYPLGVDKLLDEGNTGLHTSENVPDYCDIDMTVDKGVHPATHAEYILDNIYRDRRYK